MAYLDPYRDGPQHRPTHLRAVPATTPRQQLAILRGGQYRATAGHDALDRILRVVQDVQGDLLAAEQQPADELAAEVGADLPLHTVTCDEDGITVKHCVICSGEHRTLWDRVVIGTGRTFAENKTVYVAAWGCPGNERNQLQHILTDLDFADAYEGGAELIDQVDHDAQVLRLRSWLTHPGTTAEAFGKFQGPEDAA